MTRRRLPLPWTIVLCLCSASGLVLLGVPWLTDNSSVEPPPGPAPQRLEVEPNALRAVQAALAPPASAKSVDEAALAARIAKLGDPALDVCLAMLCGEVEPPEFAEGTLDLPIHPLAIERREQILRAAIARFPAARRVTAVAHRAEQAPLDVQLVLIGVLGETQHPTALRTILELAEGFDPLHFERDFVVRPVETALSKQLAREPQLAIELRSRLKNAEPGVAMLAVGAAALVRSKTTAEFVASMLGRDERVDLSVLRALERMARGGRLVLEDDALERVRRVVTSPDPRLQRAAIDCIGALGDELCTDDLIGVLGGEDALLRNAAQRALTGIAGVDLGPLPEHWARWRDEEFAWIEEQMDAALEELEAPAPASVAAAVRDLSAHALVRPKAAAAMADALLRTQDEIAARVLLEGLVDCRAPVALPVIVAELESESEERATRARAALHALTGLDLPADRRAWEDALGLAR
ncbi:MAG: hypothetical protein IT454_15480 [Planctomycetes bacterium]|nr:hypothetical protein [Planctomycetota bacterium]